MGNRHDRLKAKAIERNLSPSPAIARLVNDHADWALGEMKSENYADRKTLFHYTNRDGLDHILGERRLRLTGLGKLREDDREEVEYGIKLCASAVDSYVETNRSTLSRLGLLITEELKSLTLDEFGELFDFHVVCFCPHAEDLHMWKARYGDFGAGVAIGIKPVFFESPDYVPLPPGSKTFVIQRVMYGDEATEARIWRGLDVAMAVAARGEALADKREGPQRNVDIKAVALAVTEQFHAHAAVPTSLIAKQAKFSAEREVRGVSFGRHNSRKGREPYVYEDLPHTMIDSIYYGPKADLAALKALLRRHGLPDEALLRPANVPLA